MGGVNSPSPLHGEPADKPVGSTVTSNVGDAVGGTVATGIITGVIYGAGVGGVIEKDGVALCPHPPTPPRRRHTKSPFVGRRTPSASGMHTRDDTLQSDPAGTTLRHPRSDLHSRPTRSSGAGRVP